MAISVVYRQSTGSIPNSGAVLPTSLLSHYRFEIPCRPMLSKISLFELLRTTRSILGHTVPSCVCIFTFLGVLFSAFHRENISYHEVKQTATTYQAAKLSLSGPGAPFAGWIVSGKGWESFDTHGKLPNDDQTPPP
jgi:hypothetical protein